MSNNAHELSNRLLNALDNNYNVVDMHTVNEIISVLEKINITKELLETTRLGKHVNELRRKTTDPNLARRAKVLVKRWRDLVITRASPAHTGPSQSPAPRRLGGTPLTSPALSRHVLSPAVSSPLPPLRPAWGGYESDSQDVILVDDDPVPSPVPPGSSIPPGSHIPHTSVPGSPAIPSGSGIPPHVSGSNIPSGLAALAVSPAKRPGSPSQDRKAKRDKKPKKRRGHSRAGSGTDTPDPPSPAAVGSPAPLAPPPGVPSDLPKPWAPSPVNGTIDRRRKNGKKHTVDPYAALVNRMPTAGGKKVKTTKELLEQIQSRAANSTAVDDDPDDVVLIEDVCTIKLDSPVRNGTTETCPSPIEIAPSPEPLEDERLRPDCICSEDTPDDQCPAAQTTEVRPFHVRALHNAFLPGINGTRAPTHPHQFAVRKITDPDKPDLFSSIVPLYKYSDYADDYCVKNMFKVPLCTHLPWTEFAPAPEEIKPPPSPPPTCYPIDEPKEETISQPIEVKIEDSDTSEVISDLKNKYNCKIEPEMVNLPHFEPTERLKEPILNNEDIVEFKFESKKVIQVVETFKTEVQDHRTVERTKDCLDIMRVELDGKTLCNLCEKALETVPYNYCQTSSAPVVTLPENVDEGQEVIESSLEAVAADSEVDTLGRPPRPSNFTEWHECAQLGSLIALPYVVID